MLGSAWGGLYSILLSDFYMDIRDYDKTKRRYKLKWELTISKKS